MNKNIFVVPTYYEDFEYAYKMRDTFGKFDLKSDLLFVLSNADECRNFDEGIAKKCFLMDGFPLGVDPRGIIAVKKFQGVEVAKSLGYEYAIVLDCETIFTRSFNVYEVAKYLCERKTVYSSLTNHRVLIEINRRAADFFAEEEREKLRQLTNNFREYFWFNDIAFYDLSIFDKFTKKVYADDPRKFYARMSSAHFDHIIYIFYCLLYEDYKIVNLNEKIGLPLEPFSNFHLGVLESIGDRSTKNIVSNDWAKSIVNETKPFWMPYGTEIQSPNSFMLFHEDRA